MRIGVLAALATLAALGGVSSCTDFTADPATSADGGPSAADASAALSYAATVLADAPVLYYRLGESTTGGPVVDLSTSHRNATFKGTVTTGVRGAIAGDPDTAFHFDGTSSAVVLANGPTFAGKVPYSVEAWVRAASYTDGRVVTACQSTPNGGWAMYFINDPKPHFQRETMTGDDDLTGAALAATGFTHLVGTFDGTTQRLYVDGEVAAAAPATRDNAGDFGVPFVIGANGITGEINQFKGDIDEVAIYDHALSDERVRQHHKIGRGVGP
jgi:hypothetical protein